MEAKSNSVNDARRLESNTTIEYHCTSSKAAHIEGIGGIGSIQLDIDIDKCWPLDGSQIELHFQNEL